MTARRFMYVSIGVLALAAAYQLGTRSTHAALNAAAQGYVVGARGDDCYNRAGEAWRMTGEGWVRQADADLPVELREVKFLGERILVTRDDQGWLYQDGQWAALGQYPGKGVLPEGEDWGSQSAHGR